MLKVKRSSDGEVLEGNEEALKSAENEKAFKGNEDAY